MTRDDARNFLLAINAIVPYVPPMLMQNISASPIARMLEQMANTPEGMPEERPKPRVVDG